MWKSARSTIFGRDWSSFIDCVIDADSHSRINSRLKLRHLISIKRSLDIVEVDQNSIKRCSWSRMISDPKNVKATNCRTTHTRVASIASNMRRTLSSIAKRVRFCGRILIAKKRIIRKFDARKFFFWRCRSCYLLATELVASAWMRSLRTIHNKIARRKSWTTSHAKRCCKNFADNYNRNPSLIEWWLPEWKESVDLFWISLDGWSSHYFFVHSPKAHQVNSHSGK